MYSIIIFKTLDFASLLELSWSLFLFVFHISNVRVISLGLGKYLKILSFYRLKAGKETQQRRGILHLTHNSVFIYFSLIINILFFFIFNWDIGTYKVVPEFPLNPTTHYLITTRAVQYVQASTKFGS